LRKKTAPFALCLADNLTWILEPFMTSGIMSETSLLLKRGDYYEALVAIADKLSQLIQSNAEGNPTRALQPSGGRADEL
jgi:hypothetical protein